MTHICVVDDKELLRDSVNAALTREDYTVTAFGDPLEALAAIKHTGFDLILSDLKMPRMDGLTLMREARAMGCEAPIIMMTACETVSTAVEVMKAGAFDYLQKPFEADALLVLVERALEHARLRQENEALRASVDDLRCGRELIGSFGTLRDGRMLEDMERQLIERTLTRFSGHRAKSAKALGMGVRTLGMKLKQWREEAGEHVPTLVESSAG